MKKHMVNTLTLILLVAIVTLSTVGLSNTEAAPLQATVTLSADRTSASGIPGSVVTYTLTIQNSEAVDAALSVTASSAGGWTEPVIVPASFTLPASGSASVTINVPIPASVTAGQNDITTIYVADDTSAIIATLQLTTTASQPAVAGRPLVVVFSYSTGDGAVYAGREYDLTVGLKNNGKETASNIVVIFDGLEFYPRDTGGVRTLGRIEPGEKKSVSQKFIIGESLAWQGVASLKATISYTDPAGTAYTESFNLSIKITPPTYYGPAATATPNVSLRPQLVVTGYNTDIDPLQPGSLFDLKLDVKNLGLSDAKSVTVVFGGGAVAGGDTGTPQPGGVSGAGSDLTNFAPIGSSNLVFMGDIAKGAVASVNQQLVVNVTTQPGAYPLKLSFVYDDSKGNRLIDDQIITLLVYSLPQVEVSFYRDAGMFTSGMENVLPLQVTNLGKKSYVLGNMKVTADNAELMNNVSLVGALDPGGYFTLDTSMIPFQEGPMDIKVSINYTDDFNQPRFIEQVISINVEPAMIFEPTMEGGPIDGGPGGEGIVDPTTETFWSKVWRFIKGLFGLDSGSNQPGDNSQEIIPEEKPVPAIPKG